MHTCHDDRVGTLKMMEEDAATVGSEHKESKYTKVCLN
ncbi:hypothetical protein SOVF_027470 [Spinacia oleracea]|nr:hypothetical protein SOVF_027470 [Spinacia oleracea]